MWLAFAPVTVTSMTIKCTLCAVMSSLEGQERVLEAFQAGASDYLIKPIRRNELSTLWQHVWKAQKLATNQAAKLEAEGFQGQASEGLKGPAAAAMISSGLSAATDVGFTTASQQPSAVSPTSQNQQDDFQHSPGQQVQQRRAQQFQQQQPQQRPDIAMQDQQHQQQQEEAQEGCDGGEADGDDSCWHARKKQRRLSPEEDEQNKWNAPKSPPPLQDLPRPVAERAYGSSTALQELVQISEHREQQRVQEQQQVKQEQLLDDQQQEQELPAAGKQRLLKAGSLDMLAAVAAAVGGIPREGAGSPSDDEEVEAQRQQQQESAAGVAARKDGKTVGGLHHSTSSAFTTFTTFTVLVPKPAVQQTAGAAGPGPWVSRPHAASSAGSVGTGLPLPRHLQHQQHQYQLQQQQQHQQHRPEGRAHGWAPSEFSSGGQSSVDMNVILPRAPPLVLQPLSVSPVGQQQQQQFQQQHIAAAGGSSLGSGMQPGSGHLGGVGEAQGRGVQPSLLGRTGLTQQSAVGAAFAHPALSSPSGATSLRTAAAGVAGGEGALGPAAAGGNACGTRGPSHAAAGGGGVSRRLGQGHQSGSGPVLPHVGAAAVCNGSGSLGGAMAGTYDQLTQLLLCQYPYNMQLPEHVLHFLHTFHTQLQEHQRHSVEHRGPGQQQQQRDQQQQQRHLQAQLQQQRLQDVHMEERRYGALDVGDAGAKQNQQQQPLLLHQKQQQGAGVEGGREEAKGHGRGGGSQSNGRQGGLGGSSASAASGPESRGTGATAGAGSGSGGAGGEQQQQSSLKQEGTSAAAAHRAAALAKYREKRARRNYDKQVRVCWGLYWSSGAQGVKCSRGMCFLC